MVEDTSSQVKNCCYWIRAQLYKLVNKSFWIARCEKGVFTRVYLFLWILGALGAILSYVELVQKDSGLLLAGGNFGVMWVVLFGVSSLFYQYLVYLDMDKLEHHDSSVQDEYRNWVNTRLERIIRLCIVVFLLTGVGELGHPIIEIAKAFPKELGGEFHEQLDVIVRYKWFVWSATFVYVSLMLWNILAIFFRTPLENPTPEVWIENVLVFIRILLFVLSAFFCSLFWGCFALGLSWATAMVGTVFFGLFLVFNIVIGILKFDSTRTWIIQRAARHWPA